MPDYRSPGVFVEEVPSSTSPIQGAGTSTAGFIGLYGLPATLTLPFTEASKLAADGQVVLCTNFTEFTNHFGGFATPKSFDDEDRHSHLVHAVYGFFNNGGTRCFVTRVKDTAALDGALKSFEAIDELSIVALPGATASADVDKLLTHCALMQDRVAVLDAPETGPDKEAPAFGTLPQSHFAAYYHPWLQVFDPEVVADTATGKKGAHRFVPPSGHIAGIYARVDATRGVHKAPANEPVRGALGLRWPVSTRIQDGLNEKGVNCIREVNGSIRVWGARTLAGPTHREFTYLNVRRLFSYLYDSLRAGLQWTVFEPNNPDLWARITRNTTSFLTTVWASGALFGNTPEEAFYVKCDAETNPPEQRELGRVITEIGVAIVRPAEFVVIRLGQWSGPAK
jgi:hypothetical protein